MKTKFRIAAVAISLLLLSSCSKAPTGAQAGYELAGNDYVDYTFEYPEDWEIVRNDAMIAVKAPEENVTVSCTSFDHSDPTQLAQEYWEGYFESFKDTFGGSVNVITEEETKLDDAAAKYVTYTANVVGADYQFTQVVAVRYGSVYTLTYTATPDTHSTYLPALTHAVTSFKFEK